MKDKIKKIITDSFILALITAKFKAWYLNLPMFIYRLKFVFKNHLGKNVKFIGARRISLGRNVVIGSGSWINVNDRFSEGICFQICDNSFIGRDNFFTVGHSITIREYCLTAKNCSFIGSTHIYDDPFKPYIATGTTNLDAIYVGVNCFFGLGAQVLGNVHIGHGCIIGAGAVVRDNIPPFSLVVGNPAKVVKRFDFDKKKWIKWSTNAPFKEGLDEDTYLRELRQWRPWLIHPISAADSRRRDIM